MSKKIVNVFLAAAFGIGIVLAAGSVVEEFFLGRSPEPSYRDLWPTEVREGIFVSISPIDPTGTWYAMRIKDRDIEKDILAHKDVVTSEIRDCIIEPGTTVYFTFLTSKPRFQLFNIPVFMPTQITRKMIRDGQLKLINSGQLR